MMNWEAAGAIGEIVGAAAVVLTLVYLARQINDASVQVKIGSLTSLYNLFNDCYLPIYNSKENMAIWVTGLSSPEDLDHVEREIFFLLMLRVVAPFQVAVAQHAKVTLEEEEFQSFVHIIKNSVHTPGGRAWVASRTMAMSPEMAAVLDLPDAA